jgi:hypothetical protein
MGFQMLLMPQLLLQPMMQVRRHQLQMLLLTCFSWALRWLHRRIPCNRTAPW